MKWFRNSHASNAETAFEDKSAVNKGKATKSHSKNTKAGARSKRAPAKKHIFGKSQPTQPQKTSSAPAAQKRRTRLFTQMLLTFICLTLVTAFIAGSLNATLVRNYVQDSSMKTLLARAKDIASLMVRPGGSLKVINVQQLDEWENFTDAQVILIDTDMTLITRQTLRNRRLTVTRAVDDETSTDGQTDADMSGDTESGEGAVGDSQLDGTQILSAIDYELVSKVLAGNVVSEVRQFDFMEGTWAIAAAPIMSGDSVDGGVLLCQPLSQISDISRNISLIMIVAVSVSTVFAIILSLILTQRIVQPISDMTRTSRRMAEGNYGERVNIPTTTELAQLGETLNLLSGNLNTTIRSLNQEKVKMELVLSGIGEGILAVNQAGKMVHCNDAAVRLLELHEDDAQLDVYSLTERSPLIGMLIQVLNTGESIDGGWKNGAGQSVAATVSPIRTGDDLIGAVGLIRDVSEAERLEQLRRDYVANISHELRTPLTGIRGMVEPLIDGVYETEAEKQDCYQIIYQETRRLERLITDMLDISRLQDGRIHIELECMQPHGILEAAVRRLERRALDENVKLTVEDGPDPVIMGNEDRIMQVLIILIDNALKFTPAGGSITVHSRVAEGMIWISVRDTGSGIAKEDLPYIFERFYKADKSRMETRGTGLGLAIARLVVELMGGTIWCESELGHGSSFEFSLKLADTESEEAVNEQTGNETASETVFETVSETETAAASEAVSETGLTAEAETVSDNTAEETAEGAVAEQDTVESAASSDTLTASDEDAPLREQSAPPADADVSESDKAQAQMREVAAAAGVADENIEFDRLLEMLLGSDDKQSGDTHDS